MRMENQIYPLSQNWIDIQHQIKPLDMILFNGDDNSFISWGIKTASGCFFRNEKAKQVSHCGVVVTREILDLPEMEIGKLYIFESIMTNDGVKDIFNHNVYGCQIRDLEQVLSRVYTQSNQHWWCQLKNSNLTKTTLTKNRIKSIYDEYYGRPYEICCIQLTSALYPLLRWCRCSSFIQDFMFCSEFCALIYKKLGLFHGRCENVVPADFLVKDKDNEFDAEMLFSIVSFSYK
jgi:hypothetical protein